MVCELFSVRVPAAVSCTTRLMVVVVVGGSGEGGAVVSAASYKPQPLSDRRLATVFRGSQSPKTTIHHEDGLISFHHDPSRP